MICHLPLKCAILMKSFRRNNDVFFKWHLLSNLVRDYLMLHTPSMADTSVPDDFIRYKPKHVSLSKPSSPLPHHLPSSTIWLSDSVCTVCFFDSSSTRMTSDLQKPVASFYPVIRNDESLLPRTSKTQQVPAMTQCCSSSLIFVVHGSVIFRQFLQTR